MASEGTESPEIVPNRAPLRRTRTREFLLNELETRGRREFGAPYTLALRVMEERGYVSRSMSGKWSATRLGRETIQRWRP